MDLAGPVRPKIMGGAAYILNLFDVFTRFSWKFVLKEKSDSARKTQEWKAVAEHQSGTKLQVLRLDGGGEFFLVAF